MPKGKGTYGKKVGRPHKKKKKMKKMGLKSGCPDIIVEYPQGRLLYIELKTPKGRLSPNQKLWAVQSKVLGTPHFIVQGGLNECIEQVRRIVEKYIPIRC